MLKGNFVGDKLDGEGSRTYSSGKTLSGVWSQNMILTGKMTNLDGTIYEGEWIGGRPHGNGFKIISNGKRYEGMFSVGRPWGKGCKIINEKREEGYWDRAKFVSGQPTDEKMKEFEE